MTEGYSLGGGLGWVDKGSWGGILMKEVSFVKY